MIDNKLLRIKPEDNNHSKGKVVIISKRLDKCVDNSEFMYINLL